MQRRTLWLVAALVGCAVAILGSGSGFVLVALGPSTGEVLGTVDTLLAAGVVASALGLGIPLALQGWAGWNEQSSRPFAPSHVWRLWLGLVVVPPGEEAGVLKEQIEAQVAEGRGGQSFERDWPALRQELERLIWREVKAELRPALCDGQGAMMWRRWVPWLLALAC